MVARIIRNIFNGEYESLVLEEPISVAGLKERIGNDNIRVITINGDILDDSHIIERDDYVAVQVIPDGATTTILAITAVIAVTTLVVSAVALSLAMKGIPNTSKLQDNPSLRGSTNQARKNQMIPVLLGRHRVYPDIAALPFSSYKDNRQSLTQLFCFGYNNVKIDENTLKIGETPLSKYKNYQISQNHTSLYSSRCIESAIGLRMQETPIERTTASGTWKICIGLSSPSGIFAYDDNGKKTSATIAYKVEYKPHSDTNWITASNESLTLNQDAWMRMVEIIPGSAGTFDVRVSRTNKESESASTNDIFYYSILQSWTQSNDGNRDAVINPERYRLEALQIQASDQLNGIIDEINAICCLETRDYLGKGTGPSAWGKAASSNPASMILYLLTDNLVNPSPIPDSDIVWEEFEAFHTFCKTKNLECNAYINSEDLSIRDVIDYIATSNLAQIRKAGRKVGIILDAECNMVTQLFTPMNASDFSMKKDFSEDIRYFKIKYVDASIGYVETERCVSLSRDGNVVFDAAIPENETGTEINLFGCTDATQAAFIGRQRILELSRQKRTFSWRTDIEGILCAPGDVVLFEHDQFSIGIGEARIRAIRHSSDSLNVIGLEVDTFIPFHSASYGISIRTRNGITESVRIMNHEPGNIIEFIDPIPAGPEIGDLCVFGEWKKESIRLRVTSLERDANNNCTVTAVDYDPSVYKEGDIPPYDPGISIHPDSGNIGAGAIKPEDWVVPQIPGKPGSSLMIQYQYGESDRTPPTRLNLFRRGEFLMSFKGWLLGDNEFEDWVDNALNLVKDSSKPYLWMRISVDNGFSWKYSLISGPPVSFFELKSTKDTFRQNSRGAVDQEDKISLWAELHNISDKEPIAWTLEPSQILEANKGIDLNAKAIQISIPIGYNQDFISISLKVGFQGDVIFKTINGEKHGEEKPQKLPLVHGEANLPEGTMDGISKLIDGDFCLVEDENGQRIPYRYTTSLNPATGQIIGWKKVSAEDRNYSEIMGAVIGEALEGANTTEQTSAIYGFFKNLAANDAFIRYLGTQFIKIMENGAIYGGSYTETGGHQGHGPGFYIGANGTIESTRGIFNEAVVNGNFACSDEQGNIMHTAKAEPGTSYEIAPPTRWSINGFRNAIKDKDDIQVNYNGTGYTASRFNKSISVYTDAIDHDGKTREITYKIPFSGDFLFTYTVYGTRAKLEVKRNGQRIIYVAPRNKKEEVAGRQMQISLDKGDSIYLYLNTLGVSPVTGEAQKASCSISPSLPSLYLINGAGIATARFLDNKEYYLKNRLVCDGFDSNNEKKLSNIDAFLALSQESYPYPVITGSRLTINGVSTSVSYIARNNRIIELVLGDGRILRLEASDTSEFAEFGWYDISGRLTLMKTVRGMLVQSIFPNVDASGSSDGTELGSSERPFGAIHSKTMFATTIRIDSNGKVEGNINDENTRGTYKVWGAVAN